MQSGCGPKITLSPRWTGLLLEPGLTHAARSLGASGVNSRGQAFSLHDLSSVVQIKSVHLRPSISYYILEIFLKTFSAEEKQSARST